MKIFYVLALSASMIALSAPARADDFGTRFGGTGTAALQDAPTDATAAGLQDISPAAGDAGTAPTTIPPVSAAANAEAQADMDADAPSGVSTPLKSPNSIETQAGTQSSLEGPSDPEPTAQEKTESSIIHYDKGMTPEDADKPSYRMQDSD